MRLTFSTTLRPAATKVAIVLFSALVPHCGANAAHAGGPTATQKGGTLNVVGTRASDRIVIHRSGSKTNLGQVEVWDVGGGLAQVLGIYSGVQNINVDLLGGNNFLGLYRFEVAGDVSVAAGNGHNQVYLGGVGGAPGGRTTIYGTFLVALGDGNDEVRVEQCDLGEVQIDADNGNNTILFGHHLQPDLDAYHGTILGPTSVVTGNGEDLIVLIGCEFTPGSASLIDTHQGDDWVVFGLGVEGEALTIRGNELADIAVNVGHGDDLVGFFDSDAYGDVVIATGDDNDFLWLGGFDAPNTFHESITANGGSGNDELYEDPANSYAIPPDLTNFETVGP